MCHYKHLTPFERERILFFLIRGESITKIARLLNRSKSTISSEIRRNYSSTLVKTKIDKFLNVSGSRHCSIEQQCREVALCWRDVPDG